MEYRFRDTGDGVRVEVSGRLDGTMLPQQQEQILAAIGPGTQLILDLSRVVDVSGIGVRLFLLLQRRTQALGGSMHVVGASPLLLDALDAIGVPRLSPPPSDPGGRTGIAGVEGTHRLDLYPTHRHEGFGLRLGFPLPFGATLVPGGVNFSVYSRHARSCTLVLFEAGSNAPMASIPIPEEFRVGYVFAMIVFWLDPDRLEYGFRMDGPQRPEAGLRFDAGKLLLDPFARAIAGRDAWGHLPEGGDGGEYRGRLVPDDFDWGVDRPPDVAAGDLVIYEMHVRGFTRHESSGVRHPGTFAAIREKIPYLVELGVNCVELMPVFEFDELDNVRTDPETGDRLLNYWGYNTVGFFAPKAGYAATGGLGMQADELKSLVKELHRHGIQVILDVVFNHTAEGDERGPTLSFRGHRQQRRITCSTPDGEYYNFSGCGNTLNCNHPVVRDLIVNSPAILGLVLSHRWVPLRPGQRAGSRHGGRRRCRTLRCWRHLAFDPILGKCEADRGGLGRGGPLPGRQLPGVRTLGRVERPVSGRRPPVPQGRRRARSRRSPSG